MASFIVPVTEANYTETEKADKEAGKIEGVYVNSEYSRIEEIVAIPYLANSKTDFTKQIDGEFADEIQKDADNKDIYVHYHDSICLYGSTNNQLVDVEQAYNEPLDLNKLVTVCTTTEANKHAEHRELENYADYGLEFRFALAQAEYLQGDRKTDEQAFAKILKGNMLKSEVYDVDLADNEFSRASIGREPIVRVSLIDTKNGNALIAQRYIKVRWIDKAEEQTLKPFNFTEDIISCKDMFQQLFSKEMNEKIYHMVKFDGGQSMSKTQFHSIYTDMEILELRKDGKKVDLSKLAVSKVATDWKEGSDKVGKDGKEAIDNNKDLVFALLHDAEDNTSYNLVWAMNPKTVGTLAYNESTKTYASTFEIDVKYIDETGLNGDIKQTFKQTIVVPAQKFAYQGTFWKNGKGEGVFNVNPIVYTTANDGGTQKDPHVYPGITDGCTLKDYSHIEADLVNGFVYEPTKEKPANLAQFIQYIRECAEVKFIFDETRMKDLTTYPHLKDFVTSDDKTQLWYKTKGTAKDEVVSDNSNIGRTDAGINDYKQSNDLAATINNLMGADVTENKKNLPWNYDETLGNSVNECSSIIRLHEKDDLNGTDAALKLIGKEVPVQLVVAYNEFNVIPVQEFEVHFINPLTIDGSISDNFVDAEIDGSFLSVAKNFTFTDWNNKPVAAAVADKATGDEVYAHALYDYYAVREVKFLTDKTTTSLAWNAATSTYEHKEGTTDGKLPTNASLKMMNWDESTDKSTAKPVDADPTHLAYFNNHGTPVNVDYNMFLTVNVNYKWGVLSKDNLKVIVKKAAGTPSAK